MQELLKKVLLLKASSRTKRYFLRDFLSNSSNVTAAKLWDVVKTLNALRAAIGVSNEIVSSAGGDWKVMDYQVPDFLAVYLNAGKIYLNETYFKRRAPLLSFKMEESKEEAEVLSPTEFNQVWTDYNENQNSDEFPKLHIVEVEENPIFLLDLETLLHDDETIEKKVVTEQVLKKDEKTGEELTQGVEKETEIVHHSYSMYKIGTGSISREMVYFCGLSGSEVDTVAKTLGLSQSYCPSEKEVIDSLFTSLSGGNNYVSTGEKQDNA